MSFCAVHIEATATFACQRCGTFACEGCSAADLSGWCEPCASRVTFLRGEVTVGALLSQTVVLLRDNAWLLLAFSVFATIIDRLTVTAVTTPLLDAVTGGASDGLGRELGEATLNIVFDVFTWVPLIAVVLVVLYTRAIGDPPSARAAITRVASRLPAAMVQYGFLAVVVAAGTVMCVFPGLAMTALFCAAMPSVLFEAQSGFGALSRSARLVVPVFWTVLAASVVLLLPLVTSMLASGAVHTALLGDEAADVEQLAQVRDWVETWINTALSVPVEVLGLVVWARLRRNSPPPA